MEFSFSISPSKERSGLISFRMDWLALLAVQETLKSLHQHHSSKTLLILQRSVFFTVQFSQEYWKNYSFDYTDHCQQSNVFAFKYAVQVGHSFSSKEQVSLNFMAAITICSDFGAPKLKSVTVSIVSPSTCHEMMKQDAMIFIF